MTAIGLKAVRPMTRVRVRRRERTRRRKEPVLALLLLLLLLGSRAGSSSLADREERSSGTDRPPALHGANGDVQAANLRDRDRWRGAGVFAGFESVCRGPLAVENSNVPVGSRNAVTSARSTLTDAADVLTSVVSSATADCSARRLALPEEAHELPAAVAAVVGSGSFEAPWGRGGVVSVGTDPSAVRRASVPVS